MVMPIILVGCFIASLAVLMIAGKHIIAEDEKG